MTKSMHISMLPATPSPPGPPTPPPSGNEWTVGATSKLSYSTATGLMLTKTAPGAQADAASRTTSTFVRVTLASSDGGTGESQTTFGFSNNASLQADRTQWMLWGTCDGTGIYYYANGAIHQSAIGSCGIGDVLSVEATPTGTFGVFKNGALLVATTVPVSPMYAHIQQLPAGLAMTHIEPPLPPTAPPLEDVVVSSVSVERFGAMPSFGTCVRLPLSFLCGTQTVMLPNDLQVRDARVFRAWKWLGWRRNRL